ncbi:hypothetical protein D3C81_2017560 [compost metagenome]
MIVKLRISGVQLQVVSAMRLVQAVLLPVSVQEKCVKALVVASSLMTHIRPMKPNQKLSVKV